jgi:nitrogen fixation-related uncharacterized protein
MSNPNETNSPEINAHAPELHGRAHSLVVAVSVILVLLIIFFFFLWKHKKQQLRSMNGTNRTSSLVDDDCQRVSKAAMELLSLPIFIQLSMDTAELRDCAICLTEIGVGSCGRLLPACGHAFHKECIDLWFRYHSTCPVCRANILQEPCANQKVPTTA